MERRTRAWLFFAAGLIGVLLVLWGSDLLFCWLPKTERGRILLVKYPVYVLTGGKTILPDEVCMRWYGNLFSRGSRMLWACLAAWLLLALGHRLAVKADPSFSRFDLDAYVFLFPAVAVLAVFHIFPVFYSLVVSLHRSRGNTLLAEFVGLDNYVRLLHDPVFWRSMANTAWFTMGCVPLSMAAALVVALLLDTRIRGLGVYRTIYFLPVITSVAAVSLVWRMLYHPQRGLLNQLLGLLGVPPQQWLHEPTGVFQLLASALFGIHLPWWAHGPSLAVVSIVAMSVWKGLGYNVIIFLAGLQNVPEELHEAALMDGANAWQRFWNVTWPLLSPTTYFVLLMTTISSFQVFAQIFMLYAGNATDSSRVVVYYLYEKGFQTFEFGYATAMAYVLFLVIFTFTCLQRRLVGSRVHYSC